MLFYLLFSLTFAAVLVASHDHGDHSAGVYTTVMVMNGVTTTMVHTAGEHTLAATAAPLSTTASSGLARPTGVPAQM